MTKKNNRGAALLIVLVIAAILGLMITVVVTSVGRSYVSVRRSRYAAQALYTAEAGLQKALCEMSKRDSNYIGERNSQFDGGLFSVTLSPGDNPPRDAVTITSTGQFPIVSKLQAKRTVMARTRRVDGRWVVVRWLRVE